MLQECPFVCLGLHYLVAKCGPRAASWAAVLQASAHAQLHMPGLYILEQECLHTYKRGYQSLESSDQTDLST